MWCLLIEVLVQAMLAFKPREYFIPLSKNIEWVLKLFHRVKLKAHDNIKEGVCWISMQNWRLFVSMVYSWVWLQCTFHTFAICSMILENNASWYKIALCSIPTRGICTWPIPACISEITVFPPSIFISWWLNSLKSCKDILVQVSPVPAHLLSTRSL